MMCGLETEKDISRDGSHYSIFSGILPSLGGRSNRRVKLRCFIVSPYDRRYRSCVLFPLPLLRLLLFSPRRLWAVGVSLDGKLSSFLAFPSVLSLFCSREKWENEKGESTSKKDSFFPSSIPFFLSWTLVESETFFWINTPCETSTMGCVWDSCWINFNTFYSLGNNWIPLPNLCVNLNFMSNFFGKYCKI